MKNTKPNAERVWKQFEDSLVPSLALSVVDRAAYSHLLRHTRLEGRHRLRFSIPWLARGIRLSSGATREAVRRLVDKGALRLVERSKEGHVTEVRLPDEIRAVRLAGIEERAPSQSETWRELEGIDFLQKRGLREAIHQREGGFCFYCLCRLNRRLKCLDHVVPRSKAGRNSYRNIVSCCLECNSQKGETAARDHLRWLFREGRLTAAELSVRLGALDALAAGKLRPPLPESARSASSASPR